MGYLDDRPPPPPPILNSVGGAAGAELLVRLRSDVPTTVAAASRQLREKSPKTRGAVLGLLSQLAAAVPGSLTQEGMQQLVPGIQAALQVCLLLLLFLTVGTQIRLQVFEIRSSWFRVCFCF